MTCLTVGFIIFCVFVYASFKDFSDKFLDIIIFVALIWFFISIFLFANFIYEKDMRNKYKTYEELKGGTMEYSEWLRLYEYENRKK